MAELTDEQIMVLMPPQMHADLAAAAIAVAGDAVCARGLARVVLNRHAVDLVRAGIAADRAARPEPAAPPAELLCELFAFAVMCDSKLKGDGLWDEEHDMSDGLLDRVRAEIERQQAAPAAPPSSPAAAPSLAGSANEAPSSPPQPPLAPLGGLTYEQLLNTGTAELSDQEIAERAAMLIQALAEKAKKGHS